MFSISSRNACMADASAWIVTVPSAGSGVNRRAAVSLRTANSPWVSRIPAL